jgi:CBS domain-containing protein
MEIIEIMASPVFTCQPNDTLAVAAGLMWDHDVGCVPVIDERGRVVGMITDRDICMAAYTRGVALSQLDVAGAMSSSVLACSSRQTLAEAENIMRLGRVRRTPVIDDVGQLVGMISLNDLAREAMRQKGKKQRELRVEEVAATLAVVSEPRRTTDGVAGVQ